MKLAFFWLLSFSSLACKTNSDCEIKPVKCCGCFQGGRVVAKEKTDSKPDCSETVCIQVISTHKSCQAKKAVCIQGHCELSFER